MKWRCAPNYSATRSSWLHDPSAGPWSTSSGRDGGRPAAGHDREAASGRAIGSLASVAEQAVPSGGAAQQESAFRTVVCRVDGSPEGLEAIRQALELGAEGVTYWALSVWDPMARPEPRVCSLGVWRPRWLISRHAPYWSHDNRRADPFPALILHANDGSPESLDAARVAGRLAARHGCTMVTLHVAETRDVSVAEQAVDDVKLMNGPREKWILGPAHQKRCTEPARRHVHHDRRRPSHPRSPRRCPRGDWESGSARGRPLAAGVLRRAHRDARI